MSKCQTRQKRNKLIRFFIVPIKTEDEIKISVTQHSWAAISFPTDNLVLLIVLHKKLLCILKPKISKKLFIIREWIGPSLLEIFQKGFVTNPRVWTKIPKSVKIKGQIKVKIQQLSWTPHYKKSFKTYWNSVNKENWSNITETLTKDFSKKQ